MPTTKQEPGTVLPASLANNGMCLSPHLTFNNPFLIPEEDTYGSYARQLSKYFLAEGVVSGHAIFLASAEPDPGNILKVTENKTTMHCKNHISAICKL